MIPVNLIDNIMMNVHIFLEYLNKFIITHEALTYEISETDFLDFQNTEVLNKRFIEDNVIYYTIYIFRSNNLIITIQIYENGFKYILDNETSELSKVLPGQVNEICELVMKH
jgi:hypothetical protein